jgi:hypothetical protein
MAQKQTASMPTSLDLDASWTIQFAAVDPTSGAAVSGVNVSGAAIIADQVAGTPEALTVAPYQYIPLAELNSGS